MPAYRMKELEQKHGSLHQVIPPLVNQHGQFKTGQMLGVCSASINRWLKMNGYVLKMQYVRRESEADE